jgi:hypothetical protein
MEKSKFYTLLVFTCTVSALLGISLGYFVFGPMGVSARTDEYVLAEKFSGKQAYVNYDYKVSHIEAEQNTPEFAHGFIVTSRDGVVVVYHAGEPPEIMEVTIIPVNAFPQEEQERLSEGIRIYTEEALFRILEDYGS